MGRDTIQLENAVSTISEVYLLEFTVRLSYTIRLHPELPGPTEPIVEFSEGKIGVFSTKFFKFANFRIPLLQFLFDILEMDLFDLIRARNPSKVKTETRPYVAHELSLLTATVSRVIDMEDTTVTSETSGTPAALEKSPLRGGDPLGGGCHDQRGRSRTKPRKRSGYHGTLREQEMPQEGARGVGKECAAQGFKERSSCLPSFTNVSDPDPLSYARPLPHPKQGEAQSSQEAVIESHTGRVGTTKMQNLITTDDLESRKSSPFTSVVGSPRGIYQPGWGVTNDCQLDTSKACQDVVDHMAPPGLRFEQEAKLLKKAKTKIARQDQKIQSREEEIRRLNQEVKSLKVVEAEVNNQPAFSQVSDLQTHLAGEERKKPPSRSPIGHRPRPASSHHEMCGVRRAKIGIRRCCIRRADKSMSEGLEHDIAHGKAGEDLSMVEANYPEANEKFNKALMVQKDLKYSLVDELEKLKDAPMEIIMASLHLESAVIPEDTWGIPNRYSIIYALVANVIRAEKKKKCRVVCRTYRVGSAHHAKILMCRSVSVPTVAPQGLAILLADAATQTEISEDEASSRLLRSKSLPPLYNLDWL
ncbi:hypothetical protein Tco_0168003 [Tanacetum coccineum]